jgi:hypothetical protein
MALYTKLFYSEKVLVDLLQQNISYVTYVHTLTRYHKYSSFVSTYAGGKSDLIVFLVVSESITNPST